MRTRTSPPGTGGVFARAELPSLAKEGWPRYQKNIPKAPFQSADGVVRSNTAALFEQTTPSAPSKVASQRLFDRAATPPLPRRGAPNSAVDRLFSICLIAIFALTGCGYRLAARKGDAGAGQTIAVPTFSNRTNAYRLEYRISEALRKELTRSTRYEVTPERAGDVLISGEVLDYAASPVVNNPQGRASQYAVSVDFKVVVTDTKSGAVLLRNERITYREIFQLAQNSGDFVPEDPAAWDRLAARMASSVVASLVHHP